MKLNRHFAMHWPVLMSFFLFSFLSLPVGAQTRPVILAFGDSLTAGYGLDREKAWPTLLQQQIDQTDMKYRVINAGISGETTAGGLARLPALLAREKPRLVILELGANDALRGLSLSQAKNNLERMIQMSKSAGAEVLLVGMRIPPNYGPAYARKFQQMYPDLARAHKTAFLPFLLEGVAGKFDLNLDDGLHPNAAGQRIIVKSVWKAVQPMLIQSAGSASVHLQKQG